MYASKNARILDVAMSLKDEARGLTVAEGERASGHRAGRLDHDLRRVPMGLSAVLLPHQEWTADLDTRSVRHWEELAGANGAAICQFGLRRVEPQPFKGWAMETEKRRIIADGMAVPVVDSIFCCYGVGADYQLLHKWLCVAFQKRQLPSQSGSCLP